MKIDIFKIYYLLLVFFVLLIISNNLPEVYYLSWIGIFFFAYIAYDFINQLGKAIPIRPLMLLIAFVQWVIAPFLSYHFFPNSQFYYMQIPEETYMSFIIPAILAFYIGLKIKLVFSDTDYVNLYYESENDEILKKRGVFLYFIGVLAYIIAPFAPNALLFAIFLLNKLQFIGAFYLFAANVRYKYLWLMGAFVPVVLAAGKSTVFHDMLLWGGYMFIMYAFFKKITLFRKLLIVAGGIFLIMFIQYIKADYRKQLITQGTSDRTELIIEVANKNYEEQGLTDKYFQNFVDRLNQGWIIARIMRVVPAYEPFAEGETIRNGIVASLVPRLFNPDKIQSGGANFERFTHMELRGTSMNLGLVGEAYANYGIQGGVIFMFIIGLFFNISLYILKRYAKNTYEVYLWIPFLFLYVVKAEEDFSTMFNQFTKAVLVIYIIFWLMNKIYSRERDLINV